MIKKIRLSKSVVGAKEKKAVSRVLEHGYLGMGLYVQKFEEALREYLGAQNVICVNSGTAALHLALMGIGLLPGDEVLVQSLTYISCFQAISAAGAIPVACEIIPQTCTIDLKDALKRLTPKTKAIMPVHYASRTGDLQEVYAFAKRHNLRVIEDAAHAFGTVYKGKKVGSFGDAVCFSFDGIKNITCGEGGAVATNDVRLAQFIMDARLLGVHNDTQKRFQGQRSWEFQVYNQGYRYHMSNLFAALGITQLERFEKEFKPSRQRIARRYYNKLKGIKALTLFPQDYDKVVPHIFPVKVNNGSRDALREHLANKGVECGVHYYPNHFLEFYRKSRKLRLPVTENVYRQLLSLPLHPEITLRDQDYIIRKVKDFLS